MATTASCSSVSCVGWGSVAPSPPAAGGEGAGSPEVPTFWKQVREGCRGGTYRSLVLLLCSFRYASSNHSLVWCRSSVFKLEHNSASPGRNAPSKMHTPMPRPRESGSMGLRCTCIFHLLPGTLTRESPHPQCRAPGQPTGLHCCPRTRAGPASIPSLMRQFASPLISFFTHSFNNSHLHSHLNNHSLIYLPIYLNQHLLMPSALGDGERITDAVPAARQEVLGQCFSDCSEMNLMG